MENHLTIAEKDLDADSAANTESSAVPKTLQSPPTDNMDIVKSCFIVLSCFVEQTCSDLTDFTPVLILRGANWSLWTFTYISAEIRGNVKTMQSLWEPCETNLVQAESYSFDAAALMKEKHFRPAHSTSETLFKRQTKKRKKSITAANVSDDPGSVSAL